MYSIINNTYRINSNININRCKKYNNIMGYKIIIINIINKFINKNINKIIIYVFK